MWARTNAEAKVSQASMTDKLVDTAGCSVALNCKQAPCLNPIRRSFPQMVLAKVSEPVEKSMEEREESSGVCTCLNSSDAGD